MEPFGKAEYEGISHDGPKLHEDMATPMTVGRLRSRQTRLLLNEASPSGEPRELRAILF
jgi:hypothetical protein